ncbi:MAG: hypothetical protein B6D61_12495 [Bacteroidetes bacterium 4484_249]|nr:MAG: hypothetical protein B6D61_12495 [Bacteroidetes bacterium 4484_249]
MELNNIILVPTDFSDVCHNAIDFSVKIAEEINFKVCIYHVINKDTHSYFGSTININRAVQEKLQGLIDEFQLNHNVEMEYAYEDGNIFDLIHNKADDIGANVILLGTHGKKGMQHLFGSYALKVITAARVPTLIVQKRKYSGFKDFLLPVNSFTEARQKVGYAINVAKRFNSTIHIFKEKVEDVVEYDRIEIITKQIIEAFDKNNVSYNVVVADKKGDSPKLLVDHAVENSLDAIMILTEPQIGTTYFNLGPWNEKLMFNEAQIPVMCINPVEFGKIYFNI